MLTSIFLLRKGMKKTLITSLLVLAGAAQAHEV